MTGLSEEDVINQIEKLDSLEKLRILYRYKMMHLISDEEILNAVKDLPELKKVEILSQYDKLDLISLDEVEKIIDDIGFKMYGKDLKEKGNFGQTLIQISVTIDNENYLLIGEIRKLGKSCTFYSISGDFRIESFHQLPSDETKELRELTITEKVSIIYTLETENKFGGIMDDPISYLEIIKKVLNG